MFDLQFYFTIGVYVRLLNTTRQILLSRIFGSGTGRTQDRRRRAIVLRGSGDSGQDPGGLMEDLANVFN